MHTHMIDRGISSAAGHPSEFHKDRYRAAARQGITWPVLPRSSINSSRSSADVPAFPLCQVPTASITDYASVGWWFKPFSNFTLSLALLFSSNKDHLAWRQLVMEQFCRRSRYPGNYNGWTTDIFVFVRRRRSNNERMRVQRTSVI